MQKRVLKQIQTLTEVEPMPPCPPAPPPPHHLLGTTI